MATFDPSQRLAVDFLELGATFVRHAIVAIATYLFVFNNFIIFLEVRRLLNLVFMRHMFAQVVREFDQLVQSRSDNFTN